MLDTTDEKGNQDEEAVKKAGILQEKTKAEYPFLTPDATMMNGRLQGISAFPETFFVDKDGNIVATPIQEAIHWTNGRKSWKKSLKTFQSKT